MSGGIEPDTKDWTWVLDRPCSDCRLDARELDRAGFADAIHANTRGWYDVLDRADVAVRPRAGAWSPLEYACHVRDVHVLFDERLHLMLDRDDPEFAHWDQDVTATESDYGSQDPHVVVVELVEAAAIVAATYDQVRAEQWARPGRRSNGDAFTVESIGRYHLHDVIHHLWDVGAGPR